MSHRDARVRLNVVCLQQCLHWLLRGIDWSAIGFRADCRWTPRSLAAGTLLWAWSDEQTLTERFRTVRKITLCLLSRQRQLATSYQAFTKILRRWTEPLVALLQAALRQRMQQTLPDHWRVGGFLLFGVDGSRIELPRTRSHEQAYSSVRHRQRRGIRRCARPLATKDILKSNSPQLWLTTLWHAGTGLPWDWRIGPADSSERDHLRSMLSGLPAEAIIAADAGFVGYEGLTQILVGGRHFLLRVGANVRLLRTLGWVRESAGTVYLWPHQAARAGRPPLVLRLVVAHNGKHPIYLLTSLLSPRQLSDREVIRLYAKRWGVELFYRHLKQTFQRRKLRSHRADHARVEIEWSLVGLWAMACYALMAAEQNAILPGRLSFAQLLLAFRRTLRDYLHRTQPRQCLCERLRQAVLDSYPRKNKASRHYPRKKTESSAGPPQVFHAQAWQIQQAKAITPSKPRRLTA